MVNGRCVSAAPRFTGAGGGEGLGSPGRDLAPVPQRPAPGPIAAIQRFLPGGATGLVPAGEAVMGQWGAALEPEVVGSIERRDGSVGQILRCIRGMVLGTDDLCYNKPLANTKRKWPKPTPPFLSGGDVRCLRRASTLKRSKGSKKLLRELGFK